MYVGWRGTGRSWGYSNVMNPSRMRHLLTVGLPIRPRTSGQLSTRIIRPIPDAIPPPNERLAEGTVSHDWRAPVMAGIF